MIQTKIIKQLPPKILLEHCQAPAFFGVSNQALVKYILSVKASLELCNEDKRLLRWWRSNNEKN